MIGRRLLLKGLGAMMAGDGLKQPMNAPRPGQPVPGIQPGAQTPVVIANRVIVFGPSGTVTGLFVYAPGTTPGPGNLPIASISDSATDPFGNPIVPVITSYGSGTNKAQLNQASLILTGTPATNMTTIAENGVGGFAPGLRITTSSGRVYAPNGFGGNIVAEDPNVPGQAETWHSITPINGWATVNALRHRLGADNRVYLDGVADGSAATAGTIVTLGAGYQPVTPSKFWGSGANAGVPAGQGPFWSVATTGSITVGGFTIGTAGAHIVFSGSYPLD